MNKSTIIAASILGGALIYSAHTLSSAIHYHGGSIEKAGIHSRPEFPGSFYIKHEAGRAPVRVEQVPADQK